jgi:cold shock CspA family protein
MRGSVTRLNKKLGCGFIVGEDGCEAYFDLSSLEGMDIRALSIGKAVEYQEHFGMSVCGPPVSRSYRLPEANPRLRVELPIGHCLKDPEISLKR